MNDSRRPPRRDIHGNDLEGNPIGGNGIGGNADCRELEQDLATLRPAAGAIDRDRLMFLAGRAVAERPCAGGMPLAKWLWPGATAVSTLAATVLGLLLAVSHRPLIVREPYPYVPPQHYPAPLPQFAPQPGGVPGAMMPDTMANQGTDDMSEQAQAVARARAAERVALARVDYVPRTTLPPVGYVHKRQIALSLGVEALGSGTLAGGAEHPVSYRELLDDLVNGSE
jgi:hypothetical protein